MGAYLRHSSTMRKGVPPWKFPDLTQRRKRCAAHQANVSVFGSLDFLFYNTSMAVVLRRPILRCGVVNSDDPASLQETCPAVIRLPDAIPGLVTIEIKQVDGRSPATRHLIGASLMNPNPWAKTSAVDIPFEMVSQ